MSPTMNSLTPRQTAKTLGRTRYIGKVCIRHPELDGERVVRNATCVQCQRDFVRTRPGRSASQKRVLAGRVISGRDAARVAKRKAAKIQATPAWSNDFFIGEIYELAKLRERMVGGRWHVDHIVPLQSVIVCGLHVESNLQVIPGPRNESKGNRHWPDMP